MLVDSHCHLDFPDFSEKLDAVMARAYAAGVGTIVTIGTRISEFPRVLALAESYESLYCSIGIHPHEAEAEAECSVEKLVAMAAHPKIVGIGEAGLDYHYEHAPRERQRAVFQTHITAARRTDLPLIVHCRDADADMVAMLQAGSEPQAAGESRLRGVIHCFSTTKTLALEALALGFYISLAGIITFRNAESLRLIVAGLPEDRLLVETDSPYLTPEPLRGQINEPGFVVHTATRLALLRGVSLQELARTTSANFFTLFTRARPPCMIPNLPCSIV